MYLRTDKARRDWHPDLSNPPRTLPMLGVRTENAPYHPLHGGRCAGIFDPPVHWGGTQPVCQPAPSATLRFGTGGSSTCTTEMPPQGPYS